VAQLAQFYPHRKREDAIQKFAAATHVRIAPLATGVSGRSAPQIVWEASDRASDTLSKEMIAGRRSQAEHMKSKHAGRTNLAMTALKWIANLRAGHLGVRALQLVLEPESAVEPSREWDRALEDFA
jgi:hypothetical protein